MGGQSGAAREGISIEPEAIGTMQVGAGGEIMHSLHAARPGRATVRLLKTSPVNAVLSQMYAVQASGSENWGKNTLIVSDTARGDIITCLYTGFAKFPTINYAEDGDFNTYEFNVGYVSFNLGDGATA